MSHFAKVVNGVVEQVIVAEQDFIDSGVVGDPSNWIQTSYNARIRNRFAGIGSLYIDNMDIFIGSKPYPSWVIKLFEITKLDENYNTSVVKSYYDWAAPVDFPSIPPEEGYAWQWDEPTISWVQIKIPETNYPSSTPTVSSSVTSNVPPSPTPSLST